MGHLGYNLTFERSPITPFFSGSARGTPCTKFPSFCWIGFRGTLVTSLLPSSAVLRCLVVFFLVSGERWFCCCSCSCSCGCGCGCGCGRGCCCCCCCCCRRCCWNLLNSLVVVVRPIFFWQHSFKNIIVWLA